MTFAIGTAVVCWSASCIGVTFQTWLAALQPELAAWHNMYIQNLLSAAGETPPPNSIAGPEPERCSGKQGLSVRACNDVG